MASSLSCYLFDFVLVHGNADASHQAGRQKAYVKFYHGFQFNDNHGLHVPQLWYHYDKNISVRATMFLNKEETYCKGVLSLSITMSIPMTWKGNAVSIDTLLNSLQEKWTIMEEKLIDWRSIIGHFKRMFWRDAH